MSLPGKHSFSYYPSLDGLRGIAILLVILHHNFDFIPILKLGWIGVDLFFVLSGFLITEILLYKKPKKHFLLNFYARRGLRILPLYYLIVIIFFLTAPYLPELHAQYKYYSTHQVFLWTNTQNWLNILYQKPDNHMLLYHFWSLSLEEQFYLIWPLLIVIIKSQKWLTRTAFIILLSCILLRIISWLYFGEGYTNYQIQSATRVDGLCIGSLIALWKYGNPASLNKKITATAISIISIHIIVFVLVKLFFPDTPHFRFLGFTSIAAVFGLLVWYSISHKTMLNQYFLNNKYLKWLGKISFGLYVFHWPVLVLFRICFTNRLESYGFSRAYSYIFLSVAAVIVAIGISWISYTLFEKKFLALKDRFS